jgi:hypothetical protein
MIGAVEPLEQRRGKLGLPQKMARALIAFSQMLSAS